MINQCVKCLSEIHARARKCPYCKAWQSWSGFLPRSAEITTTAIVLLIAGAAAIVPANNYLQNKFYAETPEMIRWQVLTEYAEPSGAHSKTIAPENITAANYVQAQNLASNITTSVKQSNAIAILQCIYSHGGQCNNIDAHVKDDTIHVRNAEDMPLLAKEYVTTTLRYNRTMPFRTMTVRNDGWTVTLAHPDS